MALVFTRLPSSGFASSSNIQAQVARCSFTPYPQRTFYDIKERADWLVFLQNCFVPFFFGNATWASPSAFIPSTSFNWPGVQLQDPTLQRTGPVQLWQYRSDTNAVARPPYLTFPIRNKTHPIGLTQQPQYAGLASRKYQLQPNQTEVKVPFQAPVDATFVMKIGDYKGEGYYYQWFVDTTQEQIVNDLHYFFADAAASVSSFHKDATAQSARQELHGQMVANRDKWWLHGSMEMNAISAMLVNNHNAVICTFVIETPTSGDVVPSLTITLLLEMNYPLWAFTYIFLIYFIYEMVLEICEEGIREYMHLWSVIRAINYLLMLIAFVSSVQFIISYNDAYDTVDQTPTSFSNAMKAIEAQKQFMTSMGPVCLTMWVQLLQYLNVIPGLGLPIEAYNRAGKEVIAMIIGMGICVISVSVTFFVLYSNKIAGYTTLAASGLNILQSLVGYPEFTILVMNQNWLGTIILLAFEYIMMFFVLGMLTAMVSGAYVEVHTEFITSGQKSWTPQRLAKLSRKYYNVYLKVVNEQHGGSWCRFYYTRFRKKRVPNWCKRLCCKQHVDEPPWVSVDPNMQDPDGITCDAPDIVNRGNSQQTNIFKYNTYLEARDAMEADAVRILGNAKTEIDVIKDRLVTFSEYVKQVDSLQDNLDQAVVNQMDVDKTVLSLATEVLERVS